MKNMMKICELVIAMVFLTGTLAACGPGGQVIQGIDPNKTQIYVEVFDSDYGADWVEKVAEDFNKIYTEYEVVVTAAVTELSVIYEKIKGGYDTNDIYITSEPLFTTNMIQRGLLENLEDVYDSKPDGEDGLTVRQKMKNSDLYESIWSDENGVYSLPAADGITGMVFDYDLFVEKGWLNAEGASDVEAKKALDAAGIQYQTFGNKLQFVSSTGKTNYEAGDTILKPGKDGKYGTYDDGQPQNIAEWQTMLDAIAVTAKPFLWTGQFASTYTRVLIDSVFAQYDGLQNYNTFMSCFGKDDRTGETITLEEGYKVYEMDGLEKAMQFFYDYYTPRKYVHSDCSKTGVGGSHSEAQNTFVLGFEKDPQPAMLVDGIWWERGAKGTFDMLAAKGNVSRGFGKRDYRYMLFPYMEGQYGLDGKGNGSVLMAQDTGNIYMVKKDCSPELLEMKKLFLTWLHKDEYLRYYTRTTGSVRPFYYEMTEADLAEMTPFNRNVWEMYADTENIGIVRPEIQSYQSPLRAYGMKGDFYTAEIGIETPTYPISAYDRGFSVDQYVEGMKTHYKNAWQGYIDGWNAAKGE